MYIWAETMAEDDHPLEDQDHVGRDPGRSLGHVGPHQQEAEEDRRRDDAAGWRAPNSATTMPAKP